jgi:putative peptidoglycan lipid II flippase
MTSQTQAPIQMHEERRQFFGAAKLISGITLLSRITGLVRDVALGRIFGVNHITDAFYMAFKIPNLFRRLFGEGALSAAFVPVFSETLERSGHQEARSLLANVMGLLALWLTGLCFLVEVGLFVVSVTAPPDWDARLILRFATLMMPFMISICLLAVGSAALNCVKHFAYPAAAPIILNLCNIAGTVWLSRYWHRIESQMMVVALSVLAASVLQLVGVLWVLKAHGLPWRPRFRPVHPDVPRMLKMMLPMLIPLGVLQINAFADSLIAWIFSATAKTPNFVLGSWTIHKPLNEGAVTWLNFGERLYQFPLGVLAIALATAVFPLFSRYAARGDRVNLRLSVNQAVRLAIFEGLPSGVGLILLAKPLLDLLYVGRRSHFSSADATATAHIIRMYGIGMWAFCARQVLLRAFYAQKDTTTPLKVALGIVSLNFLLNMVLIWVPAVRHGAFGLSTSITVSIEALLLAWILRQRLGRLGLRSLSVSVVRVGIATAAMAAAVWLAPLGLARLGIASALARLSAAVVAGVGTYLLACLLLKAPELGEILARPAAEPAKESTSRLS